MIDYRDASMTKRDADFSAKNREMYKGQLADALYRFRNEITGTISRCRPRDIEARLQIREKGTIIIGPLDDIEEILKEASSVQEVEDLAQEYGGVKVTFMQPRQT